jgi:two-component system KDP operon response regulator KdpE
MSSDRARILLIEDEAEIRRFIRASLQASQYVVQEAETGREGLLKCKSQPPDVVLLDLGLPDISGFEVIQQLRTWSSVPIVIVSARGQEADKVTALDAGADDYLTKPFGVNELLARLRVMLRRKAQSSDSSASAFEAGQLKVDLSRRQVFVRGEEVHLTPTEYRILTVLIADAGKVLTHRQLLHEVWGPDCTHEVHYLRVYMNQLRRKIGDDTTPPKLLQTEPGIGYRFCSFDADQ